MTDWTLEEDAVIRKLRPDKTYPDIALLLPGRTGNAVRNRARRLRVPTGDRAGPRRQTEPPLPRDWFAGDRDTRAGAAVFRAGVEQKPTLREWEA